MKKLRLLTFSVLLISTASFSQTAMQFSGPDCYDTPADLFADLDAGKAVILEFYMPDCGMCPPPAEKIQAMANNIMVTYPDMVKGYAFPFQNSTTCDYSVSWVEDNDLPFFVPMDSGASQVAYYGGFGMPTVVLLGGADHRTMFSTLSFVTSDTTIMRDSILRLFDAPTSIPDLPGISDFVLYPNPANQFLQISTNISDANIKVEIADLTGKVLITLPQQSVSGSYKEEIDTGLLPNGIYLVRLISKDNSTTQRITVIH